MILYCSGGGRVSVNAKKFSFYHLLNFLLENIK
jgi:hypothetical protein